MSSSKATVKVSIMALVLGMGGGQSASAERVLGSRGNWHARSPHKVHYFSGPKHAIERQANRLIRAFDAYTKALSAFSRAPAHSRSAQKHLTKVKTVFLPQLVQEIKSAKLIQEQHSPSSTSAGVAKAAKQQATTRHARAVLLSEDAARLTKSLKTLTGNLAENRYQDTKLLRTIATRHAWILTAVASLEGRTIRKSELYRTDNELREIIDTKRKEVAAHALGSAVTHSAKEVAKVSVAAKAVDSSQAMSSQAMSSQAQGKKTVLKRDLRALDKAAQKAEKAIAKIHHLAKIEALPALENGRNPSSQTNLLSTHDPAVAVAKGDLERLHRQVGETGRLFEHELPKQKSSRATKSRTQRIRETGTRWLTAIAESHAKLNGKATAVRTIEADRNATRVVTEEAKASIELDSKDRHRNLTRVAALESTAAQGVFEPILVEKTTAEGKARQQLRARLLSSAATMGTKPEHVTAFAKAIADNAFDTLTNQTKRDVKIAAANAVTNLVLVGARPKETLAVLAATAAVARRAKSPHLALRENLNAPRTQKAIEKVKNVAKYEMRAFFAPGNTVRPSREAIKAHLELAHKYIAMVDSPAAADAAIAELSQQQLDIAGQAFGKFVSETPMRSLERFRNEGATFATRVAELAETVNAATHKRVRVDLKEIATPIHEKIGSFLGDSERIADAGSSKTLYGRLAANVTVIEQLQASYPETKLPSDTRKSIHSAFHHASLDAGVLGAKDYSLFFATQDGPGLIGLGGLLRHLGPDMANITTLLRHAATATLSSVATDHINRLEDGVTHLEKTQVSGGDFSKISAPYLGLESISNFVTNAIAASATGRMLQNDGYLGALGGIVESAKNAIFSAFFQVDQLLAEAI